VTPKAAVITGRGRPASVVRGPAPPRRSAHSRDIRRSGRPPLFPRSVESCRPRISGAGDGRASLGPRAASVPVADQRSWADRGAPSARRQAG